MTPTQRTGALGLAVRPRQRRRPSAAPPIVDLDQLGDEVREIERTAQGGHFSAVEARFAIGHRLLAARRVLTDDRRYGAWLAGQRFGFCTRWAGVLCRAAENEGLVREAMLCQSEPNIEAAVKAVIKVAQRRKIQVGSQLPTGNVVLPPTLRVECRDSRTHFPGETADLAVFSPPYPDAGVTYEGQEGPVTLYDWEELIATTAAVLHDGWQVSRVCMVIASGVGRSPYVPLTGRAWTALESAGFTAEGEIVWDKATTANRTTWGSWRSPTEPRLRDRHELVLVGRSEHDQRMGPDALDRDGSGHRVSRWLSAKLFPELTQSVWQIPPASATRAHHPSPFPAALVERLLRLYGWPGCTVVDPFAGSGTVGEAAGHLGASAVLGDQSEAYCNLMRRRLGKAAS